MSELDLLRRSAPEARPPEHAAQARQALLAHIAASERRAPARRRWLLGIPAVAAATAGAVVLLLASGAGDGAAPASAAEALRGAAHAARAAEPTRPLGPGQYLYTRSRDAYLSTVADEHGDYSAIVPHEREVWLNRKGTGWLVQTSGAPRWITDADRAKWEAGGRVDMGGDMDLALRNEDGATPPMDSLDTPTDVATLQAELAAAAETAAEQLDRIATLLRESYTTPAQRAALYEAAARLPGVQLLGARADGAGRTGTAVAIDDRQRHLRFTLIFDPRSGVLLGEEQVALRGSPYPAGTRIGWSAYLEAEVVDAIKERP